MVSNNENSGAQDTGLDILAAFLARGGRLPGFAQRRLDELIFKNKAGTATDQEQQELSEALDYIDDKSIELMAYAVAMQAAAPGPGPVEATQENAASAPLWRQYIQARLKQLCGG